MIIFAFYFAFLALRFQFLHNSIFPFFLLFYHFLFSITIPPPCHRSLEKKQLCLLDPSTSIRHLYQPITNNPEFDNLAIQFALPKIALFESTPPPLTDRHPPSSTSNNSSPVSCLSLSTSVSLPHLHLCSTFVPQFTSTSRLSSDLDNILQLSTYSTIHPSSCHAPISPRIHPLLDHHRARCHPQAGNLHPPVSKPTFSLVQSTSVRLFSLIPSQTPAITIVTISTPGLHSDLYLLASTHLQFPLATALVTSLESLKPIDISGCLASSLL